jgi:hypothetical protein
MESPKQEGSGPKPFVTGDFFRVVRLCRHRIYYVIRRLFLETFGSEKISLSLLLLVYARILSLTLTFLLYFFYFSKIIQWYHVNWPLLYTLAVTNKTYFCINLSRNTNIILYLDTVQLSSCLLITCVINFCKVDSHKSRFVRQNSRLENRFKCSHMQKCLWKVRDELRCFLAL